MSYYYHHEKIYKKDHDKIYQMFTLYVFGGLHSTWMLCTDNPPSETCIVDIEDLLAMPNLPLHTLRFLVQEI